PIMSTPQEFYIRAATENEARGPFNAEQLVSLADSGQISAATLFYDATAEQWVEFGTNAELMALVLPEKKKLRLGTKEVRTLNEQTDSTPPITVDEMLAAAEGLTSDTKGKQSLAVAQGRAAKIGLWSALLTLLLSAVALCAPSLDRLTGLDLLGLVQLEPFALLGVVDLGLALLLALGAVSFYPLLRFRAMLGLGLIGFVLWTNGQTLPLAALAIGSVGLYFCTICLSYLGVGLAALAGVGGMAGFAWFVLNS
ncbi:MAG: hypothetical protein WCL04_01765, partial [Verrucomicrobiota bacterium]